jgi:16S rRNA processing protein RimM
VSDQAGSPRVCLGVVTGARGVKGEVRVKTFTAEALDIAAYGPLSDAEGKRQFVVQSATALKGGAALRLEGIGDREAAAALKGLSLYVDRKVLPAAAEDEFYHADLIGLRVEDGAGQTLGTVLALHDFGAGDVIEIERPDAMALMLPFTSEAVPLVDLEMGRMVVEVPDELLETGSSKTKARKERRKRQAQ